MAEQLASVPEESTTSFTAPSPPSSAYRESIQSVTWPQWQLRSALSSQSGQSGSNYSSISAASSSYMSNISGCSTGVEELTKIAHRMVRDGYTKRIFQAFKCGEQDLALRLWFNGLGIDPVLRMFQVDNRPKKWFELDAFALDHLHGYEWWIRAITIVMVSIKELVFAAQEMAVVEHFGKASISAMLVFIDAIVGASGTKKLPAMLQLYIFVSNASHDMLTMQVISSDAKRVFNEIGCLLESKEDMLIASMSEMMRPAADRPSVHVEGEIAKKGHVERIHMNDDNEQWPMMFSVEDEKNIERPDYSWTIDIMHGGGVHRNTRLLVDCILLMRKAQTSTQNLARSKDNGTLRGLLQDMINYLKTELLTNSMLCLDPSLGYLFLLNNYYYVAHEVSEPSISLDADLGFGHHLKLTPECEKYMDSYLDVSWGHVLFCIPKSNFPGPLRRWINTSALAKFQSAFHKTYQTQKFWEVPDPQLRSLLRETITKKVIPGYRDYLKEHPELEKHAISGINSPEVMEEMLGELFEG
ncbi:unnamed protein product [Alopecurus aequalis]